MSAEGSGSRDEEGWSVLRAATRRAAQRLGDRLISAYAIGSLAHGGFARAVSDIDLALLTGELEPDIAQVVADVIAGVSATHELGERLSVFHCPWNGFTDPPLNARFAPIDRFDLVRYGILVYGKDMRDIYATPPVAQEIRAHAVDSALRRVTSERLAKDLEQLKADGVTVHDATKLVLWPVRLQHVCDAGQATGNAGAVEHYLAIPDAAHRSLTQDALTWRDHAALPDPMDALYRITHEIHLLHAEVFQRLGDRPDIPRHRELAERARQIRVRA